MEESLAPPRSPQMPFRAGLPPPSENRPFSRVYDNPDSLINLAGDGYKYRPPREVKDIYTPPPRPHHRATPAPQAKKTAAPPEVSPALERAITSLDATTKAMPDGALKASL